MRTATLLKLIFFILVVLVGAGVAYCLYLLRIPLIISIALAFLLEPMVNFCEMRGVNRTLAILGIFLIIGAACAAVVMIAGPLFMSETRIFIHFLPRYTALLRHGLALAHRVLAERLTFVNLPDLYNLFKGKIISQAAHSVAAIPGIVSAVAGILPTIAVAPFITYFLLADGHIIQKALLNFVPNRYFEMFALLINKVIVALELFIRGQLLDSLAVGILTAAGLIIIGIPYGLVIGVIAAFGNLIPYFGPIIGFAPALLVVLLGPPAAMAPALLAVGLVFVAVQVIEGTLVYPLAMGKSVSLHPLLVILAVFVGGQIGGIVGMIVAIPLISIVKVTLEVLHFYLKSYSII